MCSECRRELLNRQHVTANPDAAGEERVPPIPGAFQYRPDRVYVGNDLDCVRAVTLARNQADSRGIRLQRPDTTAFALKAQPDPMRAKRTRMLANTASQRLKRFIH